jgi:hypothetical protein
VTLNYLGVSHDLFGCNSFAVASSFTQVPLLNDGMARHRVFKSHAEHFWFNDGEADTA